MPKIGSNDGRSELGLGGAIRQHQKQLTTPLWTGPNGSGSQGGITYSLLCRFLVCPERFRIHAMEGLRPAEGFNHRLEYGNMWHVCEETYAKYNKPSNKLDTQTAVMTELRGYAEKLCRQHPMAQEQVEHWYNVCKVQFPEYVKFWAKHPDQQARTPLLQEQVFDVPYKLPSGRTVRLRGKWDSVDLVDGKVWLMENKSKGEVDAEALQRQLTYDAQTMMYLVALWHADLEQLELSEKTLPSFGVAGVRYNVVRRPLSGGKGTIVRSKGTQGSKCPKCKGNGYYLWTRKDVDLGKEVQCEKCGGVGRIGAKPEETKEAYYERLRQYIEAEPETYFFRWNVAVTPSDIARFRKQCLDPILERLCRWWEQVRGLADPFACPWHFRWPYGIWSPLTDGSGSADIDHYLNDGSLVGLRKAETLFPELGDN